MSFTLLYGLSHSLSSLNRSSDSFSPIFTPIAALANDSEAVKVRDWRHKLQKAFLSKSTPKEDVRKLF